MRTIKGPAIFLAQFAGDAAPFDSLDAIAAWAAADPLAVTELALTCPACGHRWPEEADLGPFVWRKVDAWAESLLDDVAQLARAYGWRESDVLALPPARRRRYLERAWA